MDSSNRIKVGVRVRPLSESEINSLSNPNDRSGSVILSSQNEVLIGKNTFKFDWAFPPQAGQDDLYFSLGKPLVSSLFEGHNTTLFAYGQTGSGKTYTMGSLLDFQDGIIPSTIKEIFERKVNEESTKSTFSSIEISFNYIEIYKEECFDLLAHECSKKVKVELRENSLNETYLEGVTSLSVSSIQELQQLLSKASKNRQFNKTEMNSNSSRSHTILTLIIKLFKNEEINGNKDDEMVLENDENSSLPSSSYTLVRMNLVDLAGSERAKKTKASGDILQEGISINKGLLALGNVVNALSLRLTKKNTHIHVPYRESKLTRLLKDSLGGNSKTILLACLSPSILNYDETINTLRFASRTSSLFNKSSLAASTYLNENPQALIKELNKLKEQLKGLQTKYDDLLHSSNSNSTNNFIPPSSTSAPLPSSPSSDLSSLLSSQKLCFSLRHILSQCFAEDLLINDEDLSLIQNEIKEIRSLYNISSYEGMKLDEYFVKEENEEEGQGEEGEDLFINLIKELGEVPKIVEIIDELKNLETHLEKIISNLSPVTSTSSSISPKSSSSTVSTFTSNSSLLPSTIEDKNPSSLPGTTTIASKSSTFNSHDESSDNISEEDLEDIMKFIKRTNELTQQEFEEKGEDDIEEENEKDEKALTEINYEEEEKKLKLEEEKLMKILKSKENELNLKKENISKYELSIKNLNNEIEKEKKNLLELSSGNNTSNKENIRQVSNFNLSSASKNIIPKRSSIAFGSSSSASSSLNDPKIKQIIKEKSLIINEKIKNLKLKENEIIKMKKNYKNLEIDYDKINKNYLNIKNNKKVLIKKLENSMQENKNLLKSNEKNNLSIQKYQKDLINLEENYNKKEKILKLKLENTQKEKSWLNELLKKKLLKESSTNSTHSSNTSGSHISSSTSSSSASSSASCANSSTFYTTKQLKEFLNEEISKEKKLSVLKGELLYEIKERNTLKNMKMKKKSRLVLLRINSYEYKIIKEEIESLNSEISQKNERINQINKEIYRVNEETSLNNSSQNSLFPPPITYSNTTSSSTASSSAPFNNSNPFNNVNNLKNAKELLKNLWDLYKKELVEKEKNTFIINNLNEKLLLVEEEDKENSEKDSDDDSDDDSNNVEDDEEFILSDEESEDSDDDYSNKKKKKRSSSHITSSSNFNKNSNKKLRLSEDSDLNSSSSSLSSNDESFENKNENNKKNWNKFTVKELKQELSSRNLPTSGLKSELVERIIKYEDENSTSNSFMSIQLNKIEESYQNLLNSLDLDSLVQSNSTSIPSISSVNNDFIKNKAMISL